MTSETAAKPSQRRYSIAHLILVIPWVALVIDAWAPIRDNSFLWHIRAGELQASASRVLTEDPFSFTMLGEPWLTQSWLAELLYAWGESLSELGFVPWMLLIASTVAFVGIGLVAFKYSQSVPATALVVILSTVLLISFLVPRPVIFSFALFPLLALAWANPRLRWTIPFLMWVWASVHGSFVLGLAYVGLMLIVEQEWKWLPGAILSGLTTLATAHGLGVLEILLGFSQAGDTLELLSEWRKPEWFSAVFTPFLIGIGLLIAGAARRLIDPRHLLVIVPFVALGLGATRAVPPAWLALVPLVALALTGLPVGSARRFGLPAAMAFLTLVLVLPVFLRSDGALDVERFPISVEAALTEDRVFHDDRVGGYLIYSQGPERLVYLDDRAELYLDRLAEFVEVRDGETPWEPVFERDGIEQALLRIDEPLVAELGAAGWREVVSDENFVVLSP